MNNKDVIYISHFLTNDWQSAKEIFALANKEEFRCPMTRIVSVLKMFVNDGLIEQKTFTFYHHPITNKITREDKLHLPKKVAKTFFIPCRQVIHYKINLDVLKD